MKTRKWTTPAGDVLTLIDWDVTNPNDQTISIAIQAHPSLRADDGSVTVGMDVPRSEFGPLLFPPTATEVERAARAIALANDDDCFEDADHSKLRIEQGWRPEDVDPEPEDCDYYRRLAAAALGAGKGPQS